MGFWQNVDDELVYRGKSRKELAAEAHFDVSYISKGIERDGIPIADTALRIARALHVSLDYLLDMEPAPAPDAAAAEPALTAGDSKRYRKYRRMIEQLELLPEKGQALVSQLIATMHELAAATKAAP